MKAWKPGVGAGTAGRLHMGAAILATLFLAQLPLWAATNRASSLAGAVQSATNDCLRVTGEGVRVRIPNLEITFHERSSADYFELNKQDGYLIVHRVFEETPQRLFAVAWSRNNSPAWISEQGLAIFARTCSTEEGWLRLQPGELLPIVREDSRAYWVRITRCGLDAEVEVGRRVKGFSRVSIVTQRVQKPPAPPPAPRPATNAPSPLKRSILRITNQNIDELANGAPITNFMVDRGSELVTAKNRDLLATAAAPAVVETAPEIPPPAPAPSADTSLEWPPILEDTPAVLIICAFLFALLLLLHIQTRRLHAPAARPGPPAPLPPSRVSRPVPQPVVEPLPSSVPKLSRLYKPKDSETIILSGAVPQATPSGRSDGRGARSAADTAIIPAPVALPERKTGGVLWIGKYSVERLLGRGRMGIVYRARQQDLNRTVALKLLAEGHHATQRQKDRFTREAQAIAKLRHPNIVTIFEVGDWEGQPFITMEFIEGQTLDKVIAARRIGNSEAARLVSRIALAVQYAHENNIIHRDLKPGNIIINQDNEPIITDFGLARDLEEGAHTAGDDILGTPCYMSPEQAAGKTRETDALSDVYAVGAILYSMLTGKDPFSGSSPLETLHKVIHEKPIPPERLNPQADGRLVSICGKAMAKEKRKRYGSAGAMARDLQAYLSEDSDSSSGGGLLRLFRGWRTGRKGKGVAKPVAMPPPDNGTESP